MAETLRDNAHEMKVLGKHSLVAVQSKKLFTMLIG